MATSGASTMVKLGVDVSFFFAFTKVIENLTFNIPFVPVADDIITLGARAR
jgi:hypothetical protein